MSTMPAPSSSRFSRPEFVNTVLAEFRCRDIQRNRDVFAGLHVCCFNGAGQHIERFFIGIERRPEAAFISDTGKLSCIRHQFPGGDVDFGDHLKRFVEAFGTDRGLP